MTAHTVREAAPVPVPHPVITAPFFRLPCICGALYMAGVPDPALLASWRESHAGHVAHAAGARAVGSGGVAPRGAGRSTDAAQGAQFVPASQNGETK